MGDLTIALSFIGGFLAFISPCCLPLYPSFLSYITGISVADLKDASDSSIKRKILLHSIAFSVGFSIIYYILGFSVSTVKDIFIENQLLVQMIGGIILVIMGLFMVGVIKPKFLYKELRINARFKNSSYLTSVLIGFIFSAGWTPCIGPIFASIVYFSAANPSSTYLYITAYTLGFCLPFVVMGFFLGQSRKLLKHSEKLMKIGGVIIILLGLMSYFDKMYWLNNLNGILQFYVEDALAMLKGLWSRD